jgi:hypothetical protein
MNAISRAFCSKNSLFISFHASRSEPARAKGFWRALEGSSDEVHATFTPKSEGERERGKAENEKKLHLMVSSALGRTIMKMNYPLEGSFYCTLKFAFLFFGRVFPAHTSGLRVFEQNGVEAFEG